MDPQLVQRTRYLLQSRVRAAKTCPRRLFASACLQLITWIKNHPILGPILSRLCDEEHSFSEDLRAIVGGDASEREGLQGAHYTAASVGEHAALCGQTIQHIAATWGSEPGKAEGILRSLSGYVSGERSHDMDDIVETLRDVVVDGLYEYLDEQIDSRNAVMGLLRKYRHRCEWFRRSRLRRIAADGLEGKQKGERSLAVDLQEYLLNQGVDFVIEQASASGEPDLVLRDVDGSHIVVDAKYVPEGAKPSDVKKKLRDGFHQVERYCSDFQELSGYLVVYFEGAKMPRMPLKQSDTFDHFVVKGKMVYYVPIVIADLPSASQAGTPEYIEVTLADLEISESN